MFKIASQSCCAFSHDRGRVQFRHFRLRVIYYHVHRLPSVPTVMFQPQCHFVIERRSLCHVPSKYKI